MGETFSQLVAQFARSPCRMFSPQLTHPAQPARSGLTRAALGPPRFILKRGQLTFLITIPPLVSRLTGDPKTLTKLFYREIAAGHLANQFKALFSRVGLLPRHVAWKSVSDVVITKCQSCRDTVPCAQLLSNLSITTLDTSRKRRHQIYPFDTSKGVAGSFSSGWPFLQLSPGRSTHGLTARRIFRGVG